MFAKVIIEYATKELDKTFIYKIPTNLINKIKVGMKVSVPFGTKKIFGFVLEILSKAEEEFEIKEISAIVDEELVLNEELLAISDYLKETTLCTKITALQTLLPSSLKAKKQKSNYDYYESIIKLNKDIDITSFKEKNKKYIGQIEIINLLENKKEVKKSEIKSNSLNTLIKNNVVIVEKIQKYRINKNKENIKEKVLTKEQQEVFASINLEKFQTYLLYGITGSGKTEVYIKLIKEVIKKGKTALLLVPEILLTMQIIKRFYQEFGSMVAVLHSALSAGEKHDEYLKIMRKEVSIVIGTRSAVFAPLENIGIIIIDEEHSTTYKQDNNPKYHAKDIAIFRAKYHNVPLVLGSATPTLESKARAGKGVYTLLKLDKRVGSASLPTIHIVDMVEEMHKRNTIISEELDKKIRQRIERKEQIILLLNRRGYATFVNCSNCGFTYKCPNCDITLTYHASSNNLICHYCGYLHKKDDVCPSCKENALNYFGLGTEKLEEFIKNRYPNLKVARMDQDTTTKKGSHEKFIEDFLNEKYDLLIGTQMVSKGLDFPKVTLVGVINADTSLNIPDFRCSENTFSLLNQVAGRSGRSDASGEVVIQTFNPDNYVINCVKNNSYDAFYNLEMPLRRKLKYPPYYYLIGLKVIGKDYTKTLQEAQKIKKYLDSKVDAETIVLGPTTALILKYNNEYRFQIIIKYRFDKKLIPTLKEIDNMYILNKDLYVDIDINPSRI